MNDHKDIERDPMEERINDLLEGRLTDDAAERLKSDAEKDHALARAIIDAYQLQRAMEHIGTERAPASLRRKLRRIPAQHTSRWRQPRWVLAYAAVPLAVFSLVLMQPRTEVPTPAELQQARQDLAVAFAYLDRVTDRTSNVIESEIGGTVTEAVAGNIIESVNEQDLFGEKIRL
ncbi:MAG: hypothetical protein R3348_09360 [Xanthomonadales bacterium]|nr:hypothetical protein [Xanthomonadales bacterium]